MTKKLILLFCLCLSPLAFSRTNLQSEIESQAKNPSDNNTSISFNYGEFLAFSTAGKALDNGTGGGQFFPFHFTVQKTDKLNNIHEFDVIYRYDNHSTFNGYNEFILMYGRRYSFSNLEGWTWGLKGGIGYVKGPLNGAADEEEFFFEGDPQTLSEGGEIYSCFQGASQFDVYKESKLNNNWNLRFGGGALLIIPLGCKNEPEWSTLGYIVHRIVPILNAGIAYFF